MDQNAENIMQAIYERTQSLPKEFITEEKVKDLIRTSFNELVGDEEFVRKFRAGSEVGDARLIGSKFSRWGMSAGDIEFLYDLQVASRDANPYKFKGPSDDLTNAFHAVSDAQYMSEAEVKNIDKRALDELFPRIPKANYSRKDQNILKRGGGYEDTEAYQRAYRAMDTAETGYGLQLIGAQYVGELWQAARVNAQVFNQIETFEMTAPTAYLPVEADIPEMLFVSESVANNSANYDTRKTGSNRVQVDAKKFVIHQMWSGEMEEDSIIRFVPFLRRQALLSIAHYSDSLVINGDTTNAATGNINSDDADPADTRHYLAFDGIRHIGLVDATGQSVNLAAANITYNDLVDLKTRMIDTTYLMDWGNPMNPSDLVYVAEPTTYGRICRIDDIINWNIYNGRPLTPFGPAAGTILGHPLFSSIALPKTEADGKVSATPANNTLGQVIAFNRRAFVAGWRRRVKTMMEPLPGSDQMRMVYSLRLGFGRYTPTGAAAGIKAAGVIYNIGL